MDDKGCGGGRMRPLPVDLGPAGEKEMTGSAVQALGQRAGLGRGQMGKGRLRKENSRKACVLRTFLDFLKRIQKKNPKTFSRLFI